MAAPFSRFARHYDQFMTKYVDYPGWVNYVERIFKRFRVAPKRILDVACGTGIPTIILAKKGYHLIGVDRSREMLEVLLEKRKGLPIEVICADIRNFTLPEPVDAAISLYDSINYLLTEEDLRRCFSCVYQALIPDGIFAFDMNTVYGLAEFWGTRTMNRDTPEITSVWQNRFDPETRVSTLHLLFKEKLPDGTFGESFEEIHEERAYTADEVRRALTAAGFTECHFYHHGSFLPVGARTTRMMIVARR
ncbi:MAG: methyltransferase domain-containing protein [candidate division WOR-3 bacterium]